MKNTDFNVVDIYSPDFIVPVRTLSQPSDMYTFCHNYQLETYVYGIYHKNSVIKIGCSHPSINDRKNTNTFGERIVRQLAKAPGWTDPFYNPQNKKYSGIHEIGYGWISESENGHDFKIIVEEYQNHHNIKLNKDEFYIHIWNLTYRDSTKFPFLNDDKGREKKALYFEALVIEQYKLDNMGNIPIGNQTYDPSLRNKAYTLPKITHEVADLFQGI